MMTTNIFTYLFHGLLLDLTSYIKAEIFAHSCSGSLLSKSGSESGTAACNPNFGASVTTNPLYSGSRSLDLDNLKASVLQTFSFQSAYTLQVQVYQFCLLLYMSQVIVY